MKTRFRSVLIIATMAATFVIVPSAEAHPLGNFTINHYVGITVRAERIDIDYVMDMAEISAYQELARIDGDGNDQVDPRESETYHTTRCGDLRSDLFLGLDGRKVTLELVASTLTFPPGAGGLFTLRLTCAYRTQALSLVPGMQIELKNDLYPMRQAWREIVVVADGISLEGDFATTSVSNRLRTYPNDLLTNPLNQRQVFFEVVPTVGMATTAVTPTSVQASALPTSSRDDAFTRLVQLEDLSLPAILVSLLAASVWGAMHALTPGHGKTVVGAYLIGSRGTLRHALFLGLTTTITHTAGVFALGLITLFASQYILPEQLYPWLSFLSGLSLVVLGVSLFVVRIRKAFPALLTYRGPKHQHADRSGHIHLRVSAVNGHQHQPHSHGHEPSHGHHHDHDHNSLKTQAQRSHSHQPPGADGSPVTWRNLLALGVTGGLLPCPSALIVLLSAIALGRVAFGVALVVAFSLGLAGVLSAIGLLFVYARRFFERIPMRGKVLGLLPALSAAFVALIGVGITLKVVGEIGLLGL